MRPLAVLLGTRPEIIKLAPVIRYLQKKRTPFFIIHSGQHYSWEMDRVFFKDLELPEPRFQLAIPSENNCHGQHVARITEAVEKILIRERPRVLFVQGDTNTVLAGSIAASKMADVSLAHVEAGLRSYDRSMPEEINRIVSDHVSDLLFAPTPLAQSILVKEGIDRRRIFVTGNTIVDSVYQNRVLAKQKIAMTYAEKMGLQRYFLMTLHRQENVDCKTRLRRIFEAVAASAEEFKMPVLFYIHPRTKKRIEEFHLTVPESIHLAKPVGFLEFLKLETQARMILTDSGGLQEEGCILGVPCVTLRTSTERPETVKVGANIIAGYEIQAITRAIRRMMGSKRQWTNPFGDGHAAERICRVANNQAEQ